MTSAKQPKRMKMDNTSNEDNVNAVFQNSLVLDNILKFLPLSDVKVLSGVNSDFRRVVRGSQRWSQNVVLNLGRRVTKPLQNYLNHLTKSLRGVKINVIIPPESLNLLLPFLGSVEFVALMAITRRRSTCDINESGLCKLLLSVFSSTPKLTHLQMDIRFLCGRLSVVLSSPAVVSNLKNIKRLDFLEFDYNNPGTFRGSHGPMYKVPYPDNWRDDVTENEETREFPFANNLRTLSAIPMRLKTFKMAKVSIWYELQALAAMYLQPLLTILRNSKDTLEELSLHLIAWSLLELRELRMPALKRLTVSVAFRDEEAITLAAFLRNHPTLEELDVEGVGETGMNLMSAIQGCTQLKKLHIKTRKFSRNVDWSFLGSLVHLKDFTIVRPEPPRWQRHEQSLVSYGTGTNFLASLPKKQLESLTLKGISKMNSLADTQDETSVGFWNSTEVEGGLESKIQLLKGFTCLRRLSLMNCLDSLDDQLMHFIVKEFVLLETLEVSHCYNLSDAGITGMGSTGVEGEANVSIANLRSLRTLIIRSCPLVTPDGIVSSVALPCLKSLEYMTPDPVPGSFVLKMAEQNPSLESLTVNDLWNWTLLKKHLKHNTRLKRLPEPITDYADLDYEP